MEKLDKNFNSPEQLFKKIISERRATPNFDGSPVSDHDLAAIVKAGMEAPSGYNLQPWRFIVVRDMKQKQRLREAAMGQPKVEEAGCVIVCCGDLNAPRGESLDAVLQESEKHGFNKEQNLKVKALLENTFSAPAGNAMGFAPDYAVWVNRHVMIAFTTMMWMAEALGYDTAPMEGFFEDQVKSVLEIPQDIRVVALLGIGKRKGADKLYAGRRQAHDICFADKWGEGVDFLGI
ncbi:nitroreductase family protein [Legionella qingyii]|uniref:Nitroreductase family protein n=1 Tax=Legionella qingyii TaxID=2184757 RepID=A0A317U4U9_9GAMM|nr:nitroreductase family protein [Legionella qingyii]PWY55410.1 nitroreductase family protein [Legionella qingyii]RUR21189.1 nitroreductase family protein [Legionella qingyii]RUR24022.1 nitroreductase family protein [Legionella qingyii]